MKAFKALKREIHGGTWDDSLDDLSTAIHQTIQARKTTLRAELIMQFSEGDRVRTVPGNYKPRYFALRSGTVTKIEGSRVWIQLDSPIQRPTKTIYSVGVSPDFIEHI